MTKKKDSLVDDVEKIKAEIAELKRRKKILDSSEKLCKEGKEIQSKKIKRR